MHSQEKNYQLLISEIEKQSRKEIDKIKTQTEKEKNETLDQARKKGEKIKREMMQEAEKKCSELKKKILSGVHLEIKKKNLHNQEVLISKFNEEVWKRMQKFRDSEDYLQVLKEWIIEGVSIIKKSNLTITIGKSEKKFVDKKYLQTIVDFIKKQQGIKVNFKISDGVLDEGGVVISDTEGKIRFDNSFTARLKRKQDKMRLVIVEKFIR